MALYRGSSTWLLTVVDVVIPLVIIMMPSIQQSYGMLLSHISLSNGTKCYYEYPEAAGMCYVLGVPERETWPGAYHGCVQHGGQLLMKPTSTRTAVVHEIMQRENITEGWVGMVKVLVPWTWTGKRTREPPLDHLWAVNHPTPGDSEEDCVILDVQLRYKMATYPCHMRAGYVCQADVDTSLCQRAAVYVTEIIYHNGSCYLFVDGSRDQSKNVTWFEVARGCAELSYDFDGRSIAPNSVARPATIDSRELYEKIDKASPGMSHDISRYWIGLTRARWISSSGLIIDQFFLGGQQAIRCVTMVTSGGVIPVYKSYQCEAAFYYICQFDLMKVGDVPVPTESLPDGVTETSIRLNITTTRRKNGKTTATVSQPGGNKKTTTAATTTTTTTTIPAAIMSTSTIKPATKTSTTTMNSTANITTTISTASTSTTTSSSTTTTVPGVKVNATSSTTTVILSTLSTSRRLDKDGTAAPLPNNPEPLSPQDPADVTTKSSPVHDATSDSYKTPKPEIDSPPTPSLVPKPMTTSTPLKPCTNSFPLTLKVYVTSQIRNASHAQKVNMITNNVTQRVTSLSDDVCLNISVSTLGKSLDEIRAGSVVKGIGYTIFMVFNYCDYNSLRLFRDLERESGSFWILVCFTGIPVQDQEKVKPILGRFDSVMQADDPRKLDDITSEVTNRVLNEQLPPATSSAVTETTNQGSGGATVNSSTNPKFILLVAGLPCIVILTILVVIVVLVVRRKANRQADGAALYPGLADSYEKISRDSVSSQSSGRDEHEQSGAFYLQNSTATQINPLNLDNPDPEESPADKSNPATPPIEKPSEVKLGLRTLERVKTSFKSVKRPKKFVHFAWDIKNGAKTINSGSRRPQRSLTLDRNYNGSARIKRSKKGVVILNAPKGGATIYTENTPNTLFYNCWTVPANGKQ